MNPYTFYLIMTGIYLPLNKLSDPADRGVNFSFLVAITFLVLIGGLLNTTGMPQALKFDSEAELSDAVCSSLHVNARHVMKKYAKAIHASLLGSPTVKVPKKEKKLGKKLRQCGSATCFFQNKKASTSIPEFHT